MKFGTPGLEKRGKGGRAIFGMPGGNILNVILKCHPQGPIIELAQPLRGNQKPVFFSLPM